MQNKIIIGIHGLLNKPPKEILHERIKFGTTHTPFNVARWTNMADPGDKVAIDVNLGDDFFANSKGVRAKDLFVHNEYVNHEEKANNHKSYGYL